MNNHLVCNRLLPPLGSTMLVVTVLFFGLIKTVGAVPPGPPDSVPVEVVNTPLPVIVAPTTGHGTIDLTAVSDSVNETVTFSQNVMIKHVHLTLLKLGDPTDLCLASARKTEPDDVSFIRRIEFVGDQGYVREGFNLGSGIEFLAGEEMTMFVNAPDGNQCAGLFIYYFDILN